MPLKRSRWLLIAQVLALLAVAPAATARPDAHAGEDEPTPAALAISYIAGTQAPDGGFFGAGQSVATSGGLADTLIATAVDDGLDADARERALARLAELAPAATTRPAYTARIVMAIVAAGRDPRSFGGVDYAEELARARTVAGWWETQNYANALAALGWAALDRQLPVESVTWIKANQCRDGGWGFQTACLSASDVDTTALTVNALVAGGVARDDAALLRARKFLVAAQNAAGGFGDRPGAETNANSTGLALSAIAALGQDPMASPWNRGEGRDPLTQLLALQTPDGGFLWKATRPSMIDNYATVQATPGVAGRAYPIVPVVEDPCSERRGRSVGRCPDRHPRGDAGTR